MRALGIDPSSSATGLAVMEQKRKIEPFLHYHAHWTPEEPLSHKDDYDAFARNLTSFAAALDVVLMKYMAMDDWVVIEKVSVSYNPNTLRKIAYYEAAAMMAVANFVLNTGTTLNLQLIQATSARKKALDKGNLSKEACAELVRPLYGESLTLDECDAIVLAWSRLV